MTTIVDVIVEDVAAVFIIALVIVTIAVVAWGSLQVIENMPPGEVKTEAKKTIEYISATGILALLLLTAGPPTTLYIIFKFLSAE